MIANERKAAAAGTTTANTVCNHEGTVLQASRRTLISATQLGAEADMVWTGSMGRMAFSTDFPAVKVLMAELDSLVTLSSATAPGTAVEDLLSADTVLGNETHRS